MSAEAATARDDDDKTIEGRLVVMTAYAPSYLVKHQTGEFQKLD